jgi:hypothetical protein
MYKKEQYQDSGFCAFSIYRTKAFATAQQQVIEARGKTPNAIRNDFRVAIEYRPGGYEWFWFLNVKER